mmetsp:Transcript_159743/g.512546  ORF Transcript_159743/g.512546 Transcript_159743/m.512546 type:complete len:299 (-) Transcript_159743:46-942(-)
MHFGGEAGVHGVEEGHEVRTMVAAHEVGAGDASHDLHLHGLDGFMVPVQLREEVPDPVESRDIGSGGLRRQAGADQEHQHAAVEVLPALELAQDHALERPGDEGLSDAVRNRQQHLLAKAQDLREGRRQLGARGAGCRRRRQHGLREGREQCGDGMYGTRWSIVDRYFLALVLASWRPLGGRGRRAPEVLASRVQDAAPERLLGVGARQCTQQSFQRLPRRLLALGRCSVRGLGKLQQAGEVLEVQGLFILGHQCSSRSCSSRSSSSILPWRHSCATHTLARLAPLRQALHVSVQLPR